MRRVAAAMIAGWIVVPAMAQERSGAQPAETRPAGDFRPPAVPLVTHDPYFSVWSFDDRLTDGWSRHWTGATQAMCGMLRVDGKTYRFAGMEPRSSPAMEQVGLTITATRTIYEFEAGGVRLTLTFCSPLLPDDPDRLSAPLTIVTWQLEPRDGAEHSVAFYFDCSAEWAVDRPHQRVLASRQQLDGITVLRVGTQEQAVLSRSGDDLRIDWGWFCLAHPRVRIWEPSSVICGHATARESFAAKGVLPENDDLRFPRAASDDWPVLAVSEDHGVIRSSMSSGLILGYDDGFCIEFLQRRLRPYWARSGRTFGELLSETAATANELLARCRAFDEKLTGELEAAGGPKFARLAVLAYRQAVAANKLAADFDGTPLMFPKENFSNGCIATVDVIYPAAPLFLYLNPKLLEAQLVPVLEYARSARWKHPFAPHDLGTYPLANGQVYGGGERTEENQMPVEECGNMLLLVAALTQRTGSAELADRYLKPLSAWARYLEEHGLDPANQLCTDDFAGHLAHNANLSLKAIAALGAWSQVQQKLGFTDDAARTRRTAERMAAEWQSMADDGDHYRLAFDKPGTWSQKYNLVWDRVLGLKLFPPEVAQREVAFYLTRLNRYGLPLDNRKDYTKIDWAVWAACLAVRPEDFRRMVDPLYDFAHESPSRVPLTDWFDTKTGKQTGFQARSVVGGVFMPMLCRPSAANKAE